MSCLPFSHAPSPETSLGPLDEKQLFMRFVSPLLSLILISLIPFSAESSYQAFEIDIEELQEISPRPGTRITDKNFNSYSEWTKWYEKRYNKSLTNGSN